MKTILTLAAAVAALATASVASAHDAASGHWEWRTQPSFGPKSTVPSRTRVWVSDGASTMANCDCAMMKADASGCMMDMSGKGRAPSAG
ncbi:hypothetical protein [Novosphingobium cyanobacteriorum]|uniref:Uncharacterized protein n=1 Tax=Novosphingobium cyanobacteriorum TaxID=3024215 RepID=A0ABT6CNK3_9SPHN|nr:hypothetical protein [Novosphingobium cyanobacteriorum]MDF8335486.1 hypothetical protein [Novosphingobium cyanobacteriorum]